MKIREGLMLLALLTAALQMGSADAQVFGGRFMGPAAAGGDVCDECCDECAGIGGFPGRLGGPGLGENGLWRRREMDAPVYFANAFPEYTLGSPNIWAGYDDDTVLVAPTQGRMPFRYNHWNYTYNENPTYGKKWEKNWTVFGENGYYGGGEFWQDRNPFVHTAGYPGYSGGYGSKYASSSNGRGVGIFGARARSGGLIGGGFVGDGPCDQCEGGVVREGVVEEKPAGGSNTDAKTAEPAAEKPAVGQEAAKSGEAYKPAKVEGAYQCNYICEFDNFCNMPCTEPIGCCLFDRVRNFFANHTCPIFGGCGLGSCLRGGCLSGSGLNDLNNLNPYGDVYYDCGEIYGYGAVSYPVYDGFRGYYNNTISYPAGYAGAAYYDCCEGIGFDSGDNAQAAADQGVTNDAVTNDSVAVEPSQDSAQAQNSIADGAISTDPQPAQAQSNPQGQVITPAQTSASQNAPAAQANSLSQPAPAQPSAPARPQAPAQTPALPGVQTDQLPAAPAAPAGSSVPSPLQYPIPDAGDSLLQTPNVPTAPESTGYLRIQVPEDAVVYINGYQTKMTGTDRCYLAQNLEPGTEYEFEISVVVVRQGETFTDTQVTTLFGGTTRSVAMNLRRAERNVAMNH